MTKFNEFMYEFNLPNAFFIEWPLPQIYLFQILLSEYFFFESFSLNTYAPNSKAIFKLILMFFQQVFLKKTYYGFDISDFTSSFSILN